MTLIEKLNDIGIELSNIQIDKLNKYYELLIEKNKVMNLTTITKYDEVVDKHFVDSLALIKVIDLNNDLNIIDIGTGAGFPGIPLKIAFPNLKIVLLDSLNKRINFLNEVIEILDLKDIKALHGRAEDFAKNKDYREKFDLCVSRAVANLSTLSEYCLPYVKLDGKFISYKSEKVEDELKSCENAIKLLGGKIEKVERFILPNTDINRNFVIIKKVKNTIKKYPRKAGLPSKEPL